MQMTMRETPPGDKKDITPGTKVELRSMGKGFMDNDSRTRRIYLSKVMDVLPQDRLEILMPVEQGKLVLLPVDGEYSLCFYATKGLLQCYARIVERYKNGNIFLLVLELTSAVQKLQRREYYRFTCSLELRSRLLSRVEREAIESRRHMILEELPMMKSVIVDISGGGLRFISDSAYNENDLILCSYNLTGAHNREFSMVSTVLSVGTVKDRPGLFEHRIQYTYINESSREEIIHFIFEEERKLRKKQS